jgi:hypothetical protein
MPEDEASEFWVPDFMDEEWREDVTYSVKSDLMSLYLDLMMNRSVTFYRNTGNVFLYVERLYPVLRAEHAQSLRFSVANALEVIFPLMDMEDDDFYMISGEQVSGHELRELIERETSVEEGELNYQIENRVEHVRSWAQADSDETDVPA